MTHDRGTEVRSAMEHSWDQLREQRVLSAVLHHQKQLRAPRGRTWSRWSLFALAAALVVMLTLAVRHVRKGPAGEALEGRAAHQELAASPATMTLLDGSEALLEKDARVQITEQTTTQVRLSQTQGKVRYDVRHDPGRAFTVRAGEVEVRVRGTSFSVDLEDGSVEVRVVRGRVEVQDKERVTSLLPGESLRVRARADERPSSSPAEAPQLAAEAVAATEPAFASTSRKGAAIPAEAAVAAARLLSFDSLLIRADSARKAGDWKLASELLEGAVARYPRDTRVASALFTLGKVQLRQRQFARAAHAFGQCEEFAPHGPLAEESIAEQAAAWLLGSSKDHARVSAQRYLDSYPEGAHSAEMRAIVR